MRKILALTSIRSDYDLMSRLYQLLSADQEIMLRLLVSGAHLSPAHGFTIKNIRADGFEILTEVETLISADTLSGRLKTAAGLLSGSIDAVKQFSPDIILYAGDREDVLIGAMLGGFLGIPTAHFFGGDHATDGHIDNPMRHATSKLSSVHFVSTQEHHRRLLHLGEPETRIFVIGSVALDKFRMEPEIDRPLVLDQMGAKEHARTAPLAVLIFHPIDEEKDVAGDYIRHATDALIASGFHVCIGASNTDPGNFTLTETLNDLATQHQVTFYRNLARGEFVNLLRHAKLIAGNSSAGIIEATSLGLPAINIGARQRGRFCGGNVVFTSGSFDDIHSGISRVLSPEFQASLRDIVNPYGDGYSAERAVHLLKTLDFAALTKKTEDPLDVHA